jgi:two-component system cell cycle response regulator
MGADETRVTNFKQVNAKLQVSGEACLVQISGPELGKKYPLDGPELTIGRDEGNDIVVDLDNVSRRHAKILNRRGRAFVTDLQSTNGTYLNTREVEGEVELSSGDHVQVGSSIFKFLSGDNIEKHYHETIYTLTIVDGLTQVHNKRYFLEFLEREMGRAQRFRRPLSLMMFDIDHFKKINDVHGHLAGDYVLRELAGLLKPRIRREECFARYGGEEFAVVMPESGPENARVFAEKVRKLVEEKPFTFEKEDIPVTVSIGVADMGPDMTEPLLFIKAADQNLYRAKKGGRNRVVG